MHFFISFHVKITLTHLICSTNEQQTFCTFELLCNQMLHLELASSDIDMHLDGFF